jgi:hypothetical protein
MSFLTPSRRRAAMTTVLVLALLYLAYLALKHWLLLADERALGNYSRAYGKLLFETAAAACASVDDMERAADKQGWATQRLRSPYDGFFVNDEMPVTLQVWIEPPIPFAKLAFASFQFDENGCLSPSRP